MNKKIAYTSLFLVLTLFVISACQQTVGAPTTSNSDTTQVYDSGGGGSNTPNQPIYYFEKDYVRENSGKEITLLNTGSSLSVIVDVGGVQDSINLGETKTINGVSITNTWAFYFEDVNRRASELTY
ncbi:MAG: hypothetical protein AABW56_02285 [Nanoarchaeota archaeon]